jgi:hypothetical protein
MHGSMIFKSMRLLRTLRSHSWWHYRPRVQISKCFSSVSLAIGWWLTLVTGSISAPFLTSMVATFTLSSWAHRCRGVKPFWNTTQKVSVKVHVFTSQYLFWRHFTVLYIF